jgi:hypothetical protein
MTRTAHDAAGPDYAQRAERFVSLAQSAAPFHVFLGRVTVPFHVLLGARNAPFDVTA